MDCPYFARLRRATKPVGYYVSMHEFVSKNSMESIYIYVNS
jgi:hypothetical protein